MKIGYTPLVLGLEKQRVKDQRAQAYDFDRLTQELLIDYRSITEIF